MNEDVNTRTLGLLLAVLHHGLANLAPDAKPAGSATVVRTASVFTDYIENNTK